MPVSRRGLLALLAVPLLVLGYTANLGFYSPLAIGLVLAAAVLVLVAGLTRPRALALPSWASQVLLYAPVTILMVLLLRQSVLSPSGLLAMLYAVLAVTGALVVLLAHVAGLRARDPLRAGLLGVGILLAGQAVMTCQLRYPDPDRLTAVLGIMLAAAAGYGVWVSFLAQPKPGWGWRVRLGLLFGVGLAVRGLAIGGSPEPIIDVNAWLQQAPRFLLAGRNPYAVEYASPYGTLRAQRAGIHDAPDPRPATYPPLAILTGVPAALLGLDVRYVNMVADLLAALLIFLAVRGRQREDLGILAAGVYLCLPRTPFMIEQAWFEPQMAALAGVFLLLMARGRGGEHATRRRELWAGAVLGALLAAKQFAVVLLPVMARACGRRPRLWLGAALVTVALILPFLLWSPGDFWDIVVAKHLARPVIPHALTLLALARQALGADLPPLLTWAWAAVMIGLLAWKTPPGIGAGQSLWLAGSLLAFVLGHKQGYFNYYVLVAYLLLWAVATHGEAPETGPQERDDP